MALSQSQANSAHTNAAQHLKSVTDVVEYHNGSSTVLLFKDDQGHNLSVRHLRESYPGEHEKARTKRYRCAFCPK